MYQINGWDKGEKDVIFVGVLFCLVSVLFQVVQKEKRIIFAVQ
ncbi:MAG: hypothetical protein ACI80P_000363 [Flavobacteriales bacterium]|jgi:hypothetical protein